MTTHRKRRSPSDPLSAKGEPDAQKDLAENAFRDRRNSAAQSKPPCQDVSEPRDEEEGLAAVVYEEV